MTVFGHTQLGGICFYWYFDDKNLYIERVRDNSGKELSDTMERFGDKAEYKYGRFRTFITNLTYQPNIKITSNTPISNGYTILNRIYKLYNKDYIMINIAELVEIINNGKLEVYAHYIVNKPDIQYIVGIKKPTRSGDYVYIDVELVSTLKREEALRWYRANKSVILKAIRDKYTSNKVMSTIPINYYEVGSVTLIGNSTLHFVLQIKKKLYGALKDSE